MQQSRCKLKLFFAATLFVAVKVDLGTVSKVSVRFFKPDAPGPSPVNVHVSSVTTPLIVIVPSIANTLVHAKLKVTALSADKVNFFIQ